MVNRKSVSSAFAIKIGSSGLMFLMFVTLTRTLGTEQYGQYAAMFGLGTFLAFAALGGQHNLILRKLSAHSSEEEAGNAHWYFRRSFIAVLLGVVLVFGAAVFLNPHFNKSDGYAENFILFSALLMPPVAMAEYFMAVLRAREKIMIALLPRDIAWRGLVVVSSVIAAGVLGVSMSAVQAIVLTSAILTGLVLYQFSEVWRDMKRHLLRHDPVMPGESWLNSSFWNWANTLAGMMIAHLSAMVVLGAAGPDQAGAYFASDRIAMLLSLPLMSVNIVAAPLFAKLNHVNDQAGLQRACRKLAIFLIAPVVAGNGVILFFGGFLLSLFDPSYVSAWGVLAVCLIGQTVNALSGSTGYLMLMSGGERQLALITAFFQTVGLLLIWGLTVNFGITVGAIGSLVGNAGWNICAIVWCRRKLGVDPSLLGVMWQPPLRRHAVSRSAAV